MANQDVLGDVRGAGLLVGAVCRSLGPGEGVCNTSVERGCRG